MEDTEQRLSRLAGLGVHGAWLGPICTALGAAIWAPAYFERGNAVVGWIGVAIILMCIPLAVLGIVVVRSQRGQARAGR